MINNCEIQPGCWTNECFSKSKLANFERAEEPKNTVVHDEHSEHDERNEHDEHDERTLPTVSSPSFLLRRFYTHSYIRSGTNCSQSDDDGDDDMDIIIVIIIVIIIIIIIIINNIIITLLIILLLYY